MVGGSLAQGHKGGAGRSGRRGPVSAGSCPRRRGREPSTCPHALVADLPQPQSRAASPVGGEG